MIGQRFVGLRAAAALSLSIDAACAAAALDGSDRWHRLVAATAGASIAAPLLHATLFPVRLRWVVPVLIEPEGLQGREAVAYVALLYGWAGAGVVAACQVPRQRRRWVLVGASAALAFRQLAADHLRWIRAETHRNPQWWNRALRNGSGGCYGS